MATATVKTPKTAVQYEDPMDRTTMIRLNKLPQGDTPGVIDQTVPVQLDGKNNNKPLIIKRGVNVEIPIWAFEILVHSGRFPELTGGEPNQ